MASARAAERLHDVGVPGVEIRDPVEVAGLVLLAAVTIASASCGLRRVDLRRIDLRRAALRASQQLAEGAPDDCATRPDRPGSADQQAGALDPLRRAEEAADHLPERRRLPARGCWRGRRAPGPATRPSRLVEAHWCRSDGSRTGRGSRRSVGEVHGAGFRRRFVVVSGRIFRPPRTDGVLLPRGRCRGRWQR